MVSEGSVQQSPREVPRFMNTIASLILRSPLHKAFSRQILLLSFHGRKSGKLYTIPVGYMREGQQLTLFTDHQWWKNLRNNAPVTLRLQGSEVQGTANVVLDKTVTATELATYLQHVPNAARAFSVQRKADGGFDPEEIRQAAQRFTLMHIQLRDVAR